MGSFGSPIEERLQQLLIAQRLVRLHDVLAHTPQVATAIPVDHVLGEEPIAEGNEAIIEFQTRGQRGPYLLDRQLIQRSRRCAAASGAAGAIVSAAVGAAATTTSSPPVGGVIGSSAGIPGVGSMDSTTSASLKLCIIEKLREDRALRPALRDHRRWFPSAQPPVAEAAATGSMNRFASEWVISSTSGVGKVPSRVVTNATTPSSVSSRAKIAVFVTQRGLDERYQSLAVPLCGLALRSQEPDQTHPVVAGLARYWRRIAPENAPA